MRAASLLRSISCLAGLLLSLPLAAEEPEVKVIAHPSRAARLTEAELRAIYLKQKVLWDDGDPIVPINREAGSSDRELFSERLFGQGSLRSAAYWNRRYFEAGEFPPATLASEEAVLRFVAANENAIGYVTAQDVKPSVAVVLVLP